MVFAVAAMLPVGTALAFAALFARGGTVEFPYPDFFAFWSYGRFVLGHPAALLFDDAALRAFQDSVGPGPGPYPFLYPPPILLALMPFGALPYWAARVAFTALGFAALAASVSAWRWHQPLPLILLAAPASFGCLLIGQNGCWSAALMLGGLRLLDARPVTAGLLLGLLAFKPPLALLVPVLLLAGGHGRAIAGAALAGAIMVGGSILLLGADVWAAWWASMAHQGLDLASGRGHLQDRMPTLTAAVLQWGGDAALARVVQVFGAGVAAWCVWRTARHAGAEARAVLPVATFLATPHAFYYDLVTVTGAVLAVLAERSRSPEPLPPGELAACAAALLAPIVVVYTGSHADVALAALVPLLFVLVRRDGRDGRLRRAEAISRTD